MHLLETPYYLLGVNTQSSLKCIMTAALDKSMILDQSICVQLCSTLTDFNTRINAELAWLPGMPPDAAQLLAFGIGSNPHEQLKFINKLDPLCRHNGALALIRNANFQTAQRLTNWIIVISQAWATIDNNKLLNTLNKDRTLAGFPLINNQQAVEEALSEHHQWSVQILIKVLNNSKYPSSALSHAAGYFINHGNLLPDLLISIYRQVKDKYEYSNFIDEYSTYTHDNKYIDQSNQTDKFEINSREAGHITNTSESYNKPSPYRSNGHQQNTEEMTIVSDSWSILQQLLSRNEHHILASFITNNEEIPMESITNFKNLLDYKGYTNVTLPGLTHLILRSWSESIYNNKFKQQYSSLSTNDYGSILEAHLQIFGENYNVNTVFLKQYLDETGIPYSSSEIDSHLQTVYNKFAMDTLEKQLTSFKCFDINQIDSLDGISFESFLADIFRRRGYTVTLTSQTRDYGADLIIEKFGEKKCVQAKRQSSPVGIDAVQEVIASKAHYTASGCIVITNNYYTNSAINLAKTNNVELIDRDKLRNFFL